MREWLIQKRKRALLTQADVARRSGISQPSYNAIEQGKTDPKPETAKKISAVLEFEWTRFYEEDDVCPED